MDEVKIRHIKDNLENGEEVLLCATQSRIRPGGSLVTPNTIYATNKRIIIRNPTMMGLRSSIEDYRYEKITGVKVQKGLFSHMIYLTVPGRTELSRTSLLKWGRNDEAELAALPKKLAEDFIAVIRDGIAGTLARESKNTNDITENTSDDPMKILKMRYAKGEISKKKYEEMKKEFYS